MCVGVCTFSMACMPHNMLSGGDGDEVCVDIYIYIYIYIYSKVRTERRIRTRKFDVGRNDS